MVSRPAAPAASDAGLQGVLRDWSDERLVGDGAVEHRAQRCPIHVGISPVGISPVGVPPSYAVRPSADRASGIRRAPPAACRARERERASALALHGARRAAEQPSSRAAGQFRDLVHAQVGPVAHHHHRHACLGRQRGQCVEHHYPQLGRLRCVRALRQPAGEQLPGGRSGRPFRPDVKQLRQPTREAACVLYKSSRVLYKTSRYARTQRVLPVRPAPTTRAGQEGLHSQPALPNAPRQFPGTERRRVASRPGVA